MTHKPQRKCENTASRNRNRNSCKLALLGLKNSCASCYCPSIMNLLPKISIGPSKILVHLVCYAAVFTRESSYCFQCVLAVAILSVRHTGASVKNGAS